MRLSSKIGRREKRKLKTKDDEVLYMKKLFYSPKKSYFTSIPN